MTAEQQPKRKPCFIDPDLGRRYDNLAAMAAEKFATSHIITDDEEMTEVDILLIDEFLEEASPLNPERTWRKDNRSNRRIRTYQRRSSRLFPYDVLFMYTKYGVTTRHGDPAQYKRIKDGSTYQNWDAAGGPKEHIDLSGETAAKILIMIQEHLRPLDQIDQSLHETVLQLQHLNPLLLKAAGKLHDVGRLLTHGFFTNEKIGDSFLKRIGVRSDLRAMLPTEDVMLSAGDISEETIQKMIRQVLETAKKECRTVTLEEADKTVRERVKKLKADPAFNMNMKDKIFSLSPAQIIMRLADEFGKRFPRTNELYRKSNYTAWNRQEWLDSYLKKAHSGRGTEQFFRDHSQIHIDNVIPYFDSLDEWIQSVSILTLDEITTALNDEFAPNLERLPE